MIKLDLERIEAIETPSYYYNVLYSFIKDKNYDEDQIDSNFYFWSYKYLLLNSMSSRSLSELEDSATLLLLFSHFYDFSPFLWSPAKSLSNLLINFCDNCLVLNRGKDSFQRILVSSSIFSL